MQSPNLSDTILHGCFRNRRDCSDHDACDFKDYRSILAIPATLVEYYFTKERVTEESMGENGEEYVENIPFSKQLKACFTDRYWIMIMSFWAIFQIFNFLSTNSMLYYCNWVLGNSVDSGTGYQILVNAIGQAPLGLGIVILWPLVRLFF